MRAGPATHAAPDAARRSNATSAAGNECTTKARRAARSRRTPRSAGFDSRWAAPASGCEQGLERPDHGAGFVQARARAEQALGQREPAFGLAR